VLLITLEPPKRTILPAAFIFCRNVSSMYATSCRSASVQCGSYENCARRPENEANEGGGGGRC
jgi:hypothetical protein